MSDHCEKLFPIEKHLPALAGGGWRGALRKQLEGLLGIRECRRLADLLAERVQRGEPAFDAFLNICGIGVDAAGVTEAVPPKGPLLIIANHPFGGADALAVSALSLRARPDALVLANRELQALPGIAARLLPLDILGTRGAERKNIRVLKLGLQHLCDGGVLVVFPAGAVAHWQWHRARVEDPPWPTHTARFIIRSGAPVLPVGVLGCNGPMFQLLGACHPFLRSALIPRAFVAMTGRTVTIRAGKLLNSSELPAQPEEITRALRHAVEAVLADTGN